MISHGQDEYKPKANEFEYLNLINMYVDCAFLLLSIYTVVLCKLHSNPLSNLEQITQHTLRVQ